MIKKMPKQRKTSWLAKLTPAQVKKVRLLYQDGESQCHLARRFKVSQSTISNILSEKVYKGVA